MADRERAGREASPSAAIIDSQTVRTADQNGGSKATTPEKGPWAQAPHHDRHRRSPADGRLLAVEVHAADIQDRDGAKGVLKRSPERVNEFETVAF